MIRHIHKNILLYSLISFVTLILACGGGGGGGGSGAPNVIYAAEGGDQSGGVWNFYSIDPATGTATLIGPIGFGVTGMAFAPDGTLYGTTSEGGLSLGSLITIDTATGAGTLVGQMDDAAGVNNKLRDITFVGSIPYGTDPCTLKAFDEA